MTDAPPTKLHRRDIRRRRSLMAQTTLQLLGRPGAAIGAAWVAITAFFAAWAPFLASSRPLTWLVQDSETGTWVREYPLFEMLTPQDVMFAAGFVLTAFCLACVKAGGKVFWVWLGSMCAVFVGSMMFYLISEHTITAQAVETAQTKYDANPSSAVLADALSSAKTSLLLWWLIWACIGSLVLGLFTLSVLKLRHHPRWLLVMLGLSVVALGCLLSPALRIEPVKNDEVRAFEAYRIALQNGEAKDAIYPIIPYSPNDTIVDQASTEAEKVGVTNKTRPPGAHPTVADIANEMQIKAGVLYGNTRLHNLTDDRGEPIPNPTTYEEARDIIERMWQTYQQSEDYVPVYGRQAKAKAEKMLAGMEQIEPGTRLHIMGTTLSGQDLSSRMVHGSRIALYIGFISTGIAVVIGILIGGLLGYFAGWVDLLGLRLVEIFASIPVIMLLIMIVAFYGRSLTLMMVVIGLTGWVGYAYFVRAEFLKLRKMDYVMAARAAGTPLYLILFRHMLPNGVAPILVSASFGIAGGIMTEATLSFLGLGLEADQSSWGQMLNQARETGKFAWWLAIYPGLAIFLTVFAYNLIGEALRDVIDPRTAK